MQSAKQKERELIIQLHNKNKTVRDIAFTLDISKSKASFWINRYNKTKSLEDKSRQGRPTLITASQMDAVKEVIKYKFDNPVKNSRVGITSKEVGLIIKDRFGKGYTLRHTRRLMKKMGLSLKTPRSKHIKSNKENQDLFRQEFKKNSRKNIWAIQ